MKVILLRDVAKIGRKGSVVDVPDGYAQNKLLPNKMAKPATPENIKLLAHTKEVKQASEATETERFKAMAKKLEGESLSVEAETNAQGHLFEALKAGVIAAALSKVLGVTLTADNVTIHTPIKAVGTHTLDFVWNKNKKELSITVVAKHA